jgi:hypothetical protein
MLTLTLDDEEQALLAQLLETRLKELSHEIHKTDSHSYRDMLVRQRGAIEQLVARFPKS